MKSKFTKMKQIRDELISNKNLPLYEYRIQNHYHPVIGQGSHDAKVIFVGEAPGENEAKTGVPFCGAAGRILDELLSGVSIKREEVYITNIVKDRPPENRDPTPGEIEAYSPYLIRQIEIIEPIVIVSLGRHSMSYLLKLLELPQTDQSISVLHGKPIRLLGHNNAKFLLPLYHPAVALYSPSQKSSLIEDFKVLPKLL